MDSPNQAGQGPGGWRHLSGLGVELAGAVIGGSLLGYWIDHRFDTSPVWLLIGSGIGIVGGLYNLIRKALLESIGARPGGSKPQAKPRPEDDEIPRSGPGAEGG